MIRVTAFGTGVCSSHFSQFADCRRKPPAFLVDCDGFRILLDCSQDIAARLEDRGIAMNSINVVAISHPHPDHNALMHFIQSVFAKGLWGGEKMENLSVILPTHLVDQFQTWWNIYTPETPEFRFPKVRKYYAKNIFKHTTPDGEILTIEGFPVYHGFGNTESYAFRIAYKGKIIVYSGDTGICDNITVAASDANLFICEASARIGDDKTARDYGHLNPQQAGTIAKKARVKKLFLTHYTGLNTAEEMIKDCLRSGYNRELIIGYDTYSEIL